MSLRLYDNLVGLLPSSGGGSVGGGSGGGSSYNWPAPVEARGTGTQQSIQLPESGLSRRNLLVFIDGRLEADDYQVFGDKLIITAPANSEIWAAKYGAGATGPMGVQGPKGDTGSVGDQGQMGIPGSPYVIMGTLPSYGDLPNTGSQLEGWIIDGYLYGWNGMAWVNQGSVININNGASPYDLDGGNF